MGERLAGKVALVTGSTSGIGRAIAQLFAREGARVVVTGRRQALGEQVVAEIVAQGGQASCFRADFESMAAVRETVQFALQTYGRLDILVNNAMSHAVDWGKGRTVVELGEEEWDRMMAVGLKATFVACQEAIPAMLRDGGGAIVTIGSVRSLIPARGGLAYDVVKSGLINLSRQLNLDFGRQGIRSNLICPGWIINDPARAEKVAADPLLRIKAELLQTVGRAGRPDDIARAALFLASEDASFIAGAVLVVDGGLTILGGHEIQPLLEERYRRLFALP
ncbi:MAG: SDR family oxidoreductase [Planctomycetes bacterium]|nr:SDR family oxidoreductase [Planctomycetota bacterium]